MNAKIDVRTYPHTLQEIKRREVYTRREVMRRLHVSYDTVLNLERQNKIKRMRNGTAKAVYCADSVESLLVDC